MGITDPMSLLKQIDQIVERITTHEDTYSIRCLVDEEASGIPSNFVAAVRRKAGDAVAEEFHLLVRDFGLSFRKEDGSYPNVVTLHLAGGKLSAEIRREMCNADGELIINERWTSLKPHRQSCS